MGTENRRARGFSSITLDEDSCVLTYDGTKDLATSGMKPVVIMVKDYDQDGVMRSSMPVPFMASVWTQSSNNAVPTLIDPTPKGRTVLDAAAAISITIAATGDNGATVPKFLTNSPLGMSCTDVVTEDGQSSVVCSWTPTSHQDGQVFNFCFTAVDDSQMESERRCLK